MYYCIFNVMHCACFEQGYRHFDFVPLSFVIPSEYSDFAGELLMLWCSIYRVGQKNRTIFERW